MNYAMNSRICLRCYVIFTIMVMGADLNVLRHQRQRLTLRSARKVGSLRIIKNSFIEWTFLQLM